jgi:hypothetical protein
VDSRYVKFVVRARKVGYEAAFREVYGESAESPTEFARRLEKLGLGVRDIAAALRGRYGTGSKSHTHRMLNPEARARHNEYRRERYAKARKYARNLATRDFPLEEIQRRVSQKYSELAKYVPGWVA